MTNTRDTSKTCSTACDWPNCTLPGCRQKEIDGVEDTSKSVEVKTPKSPRGMCKCLPDEQRGETSVMCCNQCGMPTEEFWKDSESSQLLTREQQKKAVELLKIVTSTSKSEKVYKSINRDSGAEEIETFLSTLSKQETPKP